jgi:hypothetical protein
MSEDPLSLMSDKLRQHSLRRGTSGNGQHIEQARDVPDVPIDFCANPFKHSFRLTFIRQSLPNERQTRVESGARQRTVIVIEQANIVLFAGSAGQRRRMEKTHKKIEKVLLTFCLFTTSEAIDTALEDLFAPIARVMLQ